MSTALSSLVSDGSGRVWGVKGSRAAGRKGISEARLAAMHAAKMRRLLPGVVENNWVLNKVRIWSSYIPTDEPHPSPSGN